MKAQCVGRRLCSMIVLILMWCGNPNALLAKAGEDLLVADIVQAQARIDVRSDRSCPAVAQAHQDAFESFRRTYHALPGRGMPWFNGERFVERGPKMPPQLSGRDTEALDSFIERSARQAAVCASELPHNGKDALDFWFRHANLLLFRLVEADADAMGVVESVLGESLTRKQEDLIGVILQELAVHNDVRSMSTFTGLLAAARARELSGRIRNQVQQYSERARIKRSYIGFLIGLTLFALILIGFGTKLRPNLWRLPSPVHPHDVFLPYRFIHVGEPGAKLVSWHEFWRIGVRFLLSFGVLGALLSLGGAALIGHAFGDLGGGRGFIEVLGGWALCVAGVGVLTHRLWVRHDRPVSVNVLQHTHATHDPFEVLSLLEDLQRAHRSIWMKKRAWLSFKPHRDPLNTMPLQIHGGQSLGRHAIILWKGLWHMRRAQRTPPLDYTEELCRAYIESDDEWGNAFEAYWDALTQCADNKRHLLMCQNAWLRSSWKLSSFCGEPDEVSAFGESLQGMMLGGRRWRAGRWREFFLSQDVLRPHIEPLIWVREAGASQELFWVNESLECVTCDGDVVHIGDEDRIGLASVEHLNPQAYLRWGEHLADHEFTPCMHQLDRVAEPLVLPGDVYIIVCRAGVEHVETYTANPPVRFYDYGPLTAFGVRVCGAVYHNGVALRVRPLHQASPGNGGLIKLDALHPVLFAELRMMARHGVSSVSTFRAFYAGTRLAPPE